MVLSNKKLKQTLRAAKAEAACSSLGGPNSVLNSELQELLEAAKKKKQKPSWIKKDKRRKNQSLVGVDEKVETPSRGISEGSEELRENEEKNRGKGELEVVGESVEEKEKEKKKKKGKRKREEVEGGELKDTEMAKKKKKKKKKKTTKKKKGGQGVDEKMVVDGEVGKGAVVATIESQISEDVAMKVYVGGIPYYSTEDDIRSYFESCGTITEIDCMTFPDSGKFRGIAIISFKTDAAAKRASALDGSDMGGFYLKIKPYKATRSNNVKNFTPQVIEGYNRIYVGNLSWDITEDDLKKFFSGCKISAIRFGMDKETGEFRGYAHVDFSDSLSVMMALKLDQQIMRGRPIKISCAVPKKGVQAASIAVPTSTEAKNVVPTGTEANSNGASASSGKTKRRTCYECGEKGHLSADCPKGVKAASIAVPSSTEPNNVVPTSTEVNNVVPTGIEANNNGVTASSGKTKRRTCYECGEKGHLSADCPKGAKAESIVVPTGTELNDVVPSSTEANNNGVSASSGKKKRRTCYECGEKGHISADCPKKQTNDLTDSKSC